MLLSSILLVVINVLVLSLYLNTKLGEKDLQYCNFNCAETVQQALSRELYMRYFYFFLFTYCVATALMSCQKEDILAISKQDKEFSQVLHEVNSEGASENTLIVTPQESTELILNPGKGFVQYWDFDPDYQNMYTTGYVRYDWADIEPKEGQYNWNLIDTEIRIYKAAGKKFAFGVMCANTNRDGNTPDKGKYVTPQWVFNKGAKGRTIDATYWETGVTKTQVIPVWTDAIFLAELKKFIKEFGKRYDGNPDVAFIDVRSYGNWGEQHLYELGGVDISGAQLIADHLQPYRKAFVKTQLISPRGDDHLYNAYEWAVNNGIGLRSDGMFKYTDGNEVTMAHKKAPAVFEYVNSYKWLIEEGIWTNTALAEYVEIGKPSYIQFNAEMYEAHKEMIVTVGNRMGYHFVLNSAKVPLAMSNGVTYNIETNFKNKGVTNIYQDCYVAVSLIDEKGNIVKKQFMDSIKPKEWNSDTSVNNISNVSFSGIKPGTYTMAIGLFKNKADVNPIYQLGNTNKISNNWYVLNSATIVN